MAVGQKEFPLRVKSGDILHASTSPTVKADLFSGQLLWTPALGLHKKFQYAAGKNSASRMQIYGHWQKLTERTAQQQLDRFQLKVIGWDKGVWFITRKHLIRNNATWYIRHSRQSQIHMVFFLVVARLFRLRSSSRSKITRLFTSRAKLSIFALSLNFNDLDAALSHEEINNSSALKLKWISFPLSFFPRSPVFKQLDRKAASNI